MVEHNNRETVQNLCYEKHVFLLCFLVDDWFILAKWRHTDLARKTNYALFIIIHLTYYALSFDRHNSAIETQLTKMLVAHERKKSLKCWRERERKVYTLNNNRYTAIYLILNITRIHFLSLILLLLLVPFIFFLAYFTALSNVYYFWAYRNKSDSWFEMNIFFLFEIRFFFLLSIE